MVTYIDSGSLRDIEHYAPDHRIAGFTTNPSLMKQAGVTNYRAFAKTVLGMIGGKEVSFEVLADSRDEMIKQALQIAEWGDNVFVKIPIFYQDGTLTTELMRYIAKEGVKVNATAMCSQKLAMEALKVLNRGNHIISFFAGRMMDCGTDAKPSVWHLTKVRYSPTRILWASTREVYNMYTAERNCDIVTVTPSLFEKYHALHGKQLRTYSLETSRQFYADGRGIEF